MGLSGNKKKTKLSTDPNNNNWAKSTNSFGHRILASQGWKPGDYLGATNAAHSDHYTAANASHIRVMLREDGLGLGAKVGGKSNAETFGLSTLSGIFGRLNGKSDEEVQKKQYDLRDAELRSYQAGKYGFMNFVRGGLLVGDKMEAEPEKTLPAKTVDAKSATAPAEVTQNNKRKAEDGSATEKSSKSRKKAERKDDETGAESASEPDAKRSEKSKSKKKQKRVEEPTDQSNSDSSDSSAKARSAEKQAKRERKEQRRAERAQRKADTGEDGDEKARLKQEKRAHKDERRKKKEEKRRARAEKSGDSTATSSAAVTPATSGTSTPTTAQPAMGRQAIRQRYIQQKRMASMDSKALNEILMIKAPA
ncbi:hypothetical protein KC338_g9275 [Hortaea werneckii]|nr:hypothetical protein KC338_g9275 [Hortaea werneckii]